MENKFRIAVVGIGGVGGYYGSRLAKKYGNSEDYEIIFIARGAHKKEIAANGLTIKYEGTSEAVHPTVVTDDMASLGKLDLVIFSVKSYSLHQVAEQLKDSIGESTFLLPLLNGIESIEYLGQLYPEAKLLWGCTYIISSVASPGVVEVQGKYNRLVWGNPALAPEELAAIKAIFENADIHNELYSDIKDKVWEKFSFISPLASFTSYTNEPAGNILQQETLKEQLRELILELKSVATAKGIRLPADIIEHNIQLLNKFPKETTSSMHRDYINGNQTELENLTGYIVREGEKAGIATPAYHRIYKSLKKK